MFCQRCKKEIDASGLFCEFCGEKIKKLFIPNLDIKGILWSKDSIFFGLFVTVIVLLLWFMINFDHLSFWTNDFNDAYLFVQIYIFCISLYAVLARAKQNGINTVFPFIVMGIILNPFGFFEFTKGMIFPLMIGALGFFSFFSYREFCGIFLKKKKILEGYAEKMSSAEKLIVKAQYPEMENLFLEIDSQIETMKKYE
jgi:hypothetical protein